MSGDKKRPKGEGDREADRRYRERTREFVESGRVEEAAEKARRESGKDDEQAEEAGRSRAREEDPEVRRNYDKPARDS